MQYYVYISYKQLLKKQLEEIKINYLKNDLVQKLGFTIKAI